MQRVQRSWLAGVLLATVTLVGTQASPLGATAAHAAGAPAPSSVSLAAASNAPIAGPLRRSAQNTHFFVDATGRAVPLMGSHTWNDFQDWGAHNATSPMDFNAYVAMLTANHQNFTFLWATELPHFCGLPTGAVTNFDVPTMPWLRTGPGLAADGLPKFDLTKFDQAYFDRVRSRVEQLNAAGIYTAVYTATGEWLNIFRCTGDGFPLTGTNNINGVDDHGGVGAITMRSPNAVTAAQDAYVEKLVDTLNDLPNVLWATSEEAPRSAMWWNNHEITHLHAYEATKPYQHPVGFGAYVDGSDADLLNSDADWIAPYARIFGMNNCGTGAPTCKVVINDSDHSYFGLWNDSSLSVRNYIWDNFMNGNSVAFMDPWVVYYPQGNRNNCANPVNGICSGPDHRYDELRANLGYARQYADRTNFAAMSSSNTLASTGNVLANTTPTATEFLVYSDTGGPFTVDLSNTTRPLGVEWLNPTTGGRSAGPAVTGGSAKQSFTAPFSGDAVLYIYDLAVGGGDSQAPTAPGGLTATPVSSTQITLSWNSSTDNTAVTGYRVYRDGTLVGSPSTNQYQSNGLNPGTTYTYTVAAYDAAGNTSGSTAPVSATTYSVTPDTTAPTVSMTAPAGGSTVQATITLSADAHDDVSVAGVQFLVDGVSLGSEDQTAPYGATWDTRSAANGTHTVAARARDAANNVATSPSVTVTVNNPPAPSGLAAGYAFDENSGSTATDASGHSLTGTLMNGPTWNAAGRFGSAMAFDGRDDHVTLRNPTGLQFTGSMTVGGWIYSSAYPVDDAAIVSKRGPTGYQLDTTIDTGPRVVGFKLTNSSGQKMARYGQTPLQLNTWYYVAGVYDAAAKTMDVYVNGNLDNGAQQGAITPTQANSPNNVLIGQRADGGFNFSGRIDNVRMYGRALSQSELRTDMNQPLG
jgi:chitodextrinase